MITKDRFIRNDRKDHLSNSTMHTYQHYCGMTVTIIPKPRFSEKFAALIVPFGSVHTRFRNWNAAGEPIDVPAGTAHFLNRCIFSAINAGGNDPLTNRFAALGAEADVWTGHSYTMYTIKGVAHFVEAMRLAFDALLHPDFSETNLEKIRCAIETEQHFQQDHPRYRAYRQVMQNLFFKHGCRYDVTGDAASLAQVGRGHLKAAYHHFYGLPDLGLVVAGDFDADMVNEILDMVDSAAPDAPVRQPVMPVSPDEPPKTRCYGDTVTADVPNQMFMIGYKDPSVNAQTHSIGFNLLFKRVAGQLFLDTLIGPSAPLYETLYAQGVINDTFSCRYHREQDCSYVLISGESDCPEAAAEMVYDSLAEAIRNNRLDESLFTLQKQVRAGRFIRSLDSVEATGLAAAHCRLNNVDLFEYSGSFMRISLADTVQSMRFMMDPGVSTRVIVRKTKD